MTLRKWLMGLSVIGLILISLSRNSTLLMQSDEPPSPEAHFQAADTSPLVGEPFELVLILILPKNDTVVEWPSFNEETGFFEITTVQEVKIIEQGDGSLQYSQQFTGRLWKPDEFSTPETYILYQVAGETNPRSLPVRPVQFTVPSVLDRGDLNLRPDRPPIHLFYLPTWAIILIVIIVISGGRFAIDHWEEYLRRHQVSQSPAPDAFTVAQSQLADLAKHTTTSDQLAAIQLIIRDYLYQQFGFDNYARTLPDLQKNLLKSQFLESHYLVALSKLLYQIDALRFTGLEIKSDTIQNIAKQTHHWLKDVHGVDRAEGEPL